MKPLHQLHQHERQHERRPARAEPLRRLHHRAAPRGRHRGRAAAPAVQARPRRRIFGVCRPQRLIRPLLPSTPGFRSTSARRRWRPAPRPAASACRSTHKERGGSPCVSAASPRPSPSAPRSSLAPRSPAASKAERPLRRPRQQLPQQRPGRLQHRRLGSGSSGSASQSGPSVSVNPGSGAIG